MDINIDAAVAGDNPVFNHINNFNRNRCLLVERFFDLILVLGKINASLREKNFLTNFCVPDRTDVDINLCTIFNCLIQVKIGIILKLVPRNLTLRFVANVYIDRFVVITDNDALHGSTSVELRDLFDIVCETDITLL